MKEATTGTQMTETEARREFLKKVGKLGVTVPAVSLILAANQKAAAVPVLPYGGVRDEQLP